MLPYIDFDTIKRNPKVYMWFSDSTVSNFICYKSWLVSFSWPSIMAWFWELWWLYQYTYESLKRFIFSNKVVWELIENDWYRTNEKIEWSLKITEKRKANKSDWWRRIQWKWIVSWGLIGWCIEVFPMINWTSIWPDISVWKWKILFIETSEEKIKEDQYERIIRNLWSQWILHLINGILVWRSQIDYDSWIQINYDQSLLKVIRGEFNISWLPIITNMDFWHTDPMMVMPLWVDAKIDCDKKNILILENTCV
jgi:muramoyltetrapeptide carboxypeptidase LdcA involved in peptidoglycan recycling